MIIIVIIHLRLGNCSRTCKGETITSRNTGRNLRGCRKVNGSLNISVAGGCKYDRVMTIKKKLYHFTIITLCTHNSLLKKSHILRTTLHCIIFPSEHHAAT